MRQILFVIGKGSLIAETAVGMHAEAAEEIQRSYGSREAQIFRIQSPSVLSAYCICVPSDKLHLNSEA